jgi:hydrophobic/amphiphilic exporter-1 (mainly G- bacteria), HAE1 family
VLKLEIEEEGRRRTGTRKTGVDRAYLRMLRWSLAPPLGDRHRCLVTFASTFRCDRNIGRDWMPQEDQNELSLSIEMPEGSSLEAHRAHLDLELAEQDREGPRRHRGDAVASRPGSSVAMTQMTILLDPPHEAGDINEMAAQIRAQLRRLLLCEAAHQLSQRAGRARFLCPDPRHAAGTGPGTAVPDRWRGSGELMKRPEVVDIRANVNFSNPELQVNRPPTASRPGRKGERHRQRGAAADVWRGRDLTFKEGSEQYPVTMRLWNSATIQEVLSRLLVPSARLGLIRLDSSPGSSAARVPAASTATTASSHRPYGNVARAIRSDAAATATQQVVVTGLDLPPGYQLRFSGQVKMLEETTLNMIWPSAWRRSSCTWCWRRSLRASPTRSSSC